MAYEESVENNQQDKDSTACETLRQAYLDLCRGIGTAGTGLLTDSLSGLANIGKSLQEAQNLEIGLKIKDLADNRFPVRERASAALEQFGAAALPALVKAQKDPDLEVSRRADRLVDRLISGRLPNFESQLSALTYSFLDPRTDKAICKDFKDTIQAIDAIAADPAKVKVRLDEIAAVRRHVPLNELQTAALLSQERELRAISRLSAESRQQFAAYLLSSGDPQEARTVLGEAMQKYPAIAAQRRFMKLACAAGADQDKEFAQAFVKHGGSPEELMKVKNEKTLTQQFIQGASDRIQLGVDKVKMGAGEMRQELNRIFKKKGDQ